MLSLRNLSRTAVRQASRLSAKQQPSASAAARRSLSTTTIYNNSYRSGALRQTTSRITSLLPSRAAFSTTQAVQQTQEGQVDGELAAKLQEEYNLEEEMGVVDELPSHLKSFLDESGFVVTETPGSEEVVLTRQFGSETIKVSFSTADLDAFDPEDDAFGGEDGALADEGADPSAVAGAPKGGAAAAAEQQAAFEGEDADVEDPDAGFPARIDVTVEKPGVEGAMQFAATVNDGQVILENIYYFPQRAAADAQSAEADWQRRALYTGPPYGNLDPDLQVLLERYLDERGVNTGLAIFIPEYIDFKEQREYLAWLQNLKNFVDA